MKQFIRSSFLFMFFFSFSQGILAWNALGHMVVANIAYQNLKPNVKEKVDKLLTYFQKEYPYIGSFTEISYWPDAIRSQKIETFTHWHYIDVPFSDDGTPLKNTISNDNAVWVMKNISDVMKNDHANPYERARFLGFLIHIVGDLHQPLHTVTRISASNPDGDEGGNLYLVYWNSKRLKLHQLWDEGVGLFSGDNSQEHADRITKTITDLYPKSYFGNKVNDLNTDDWTAEGMDNAKNHVYATPENGTVTSRYISENRQVVQQEVALAGYRAANLLNQLLG